LHVGDRRTQRVVDFELQDFGDVKDSIIRERRRAVGRDPGELLEVEDQSGWRLGGRVPEVSHGPTDEYHLRFTTAYEASKIIRDAGLAIVRLRGHAGTWCGGLYPRLLVNRYTKQYFDPFYDVLVRARPSLFGRYLCFYAIKEA